MKALNIYVLYENAKDFPNEYIVRRWEVQDVGVPCEIVFRDKAVDNLRFKLFKMGLKKVERMPSDDPVIVETWL